MLLPTGVAVHSINIFAGIARNTSISSAYCYVLTCKFDKPNSHTRAYNVRFVAMPAQQKRYRMKNRIEQKFLDVLKQFADGYWTTELEQAHELFDTPYPPKDDRDYIKKTTFLDNAKRSKLQMLKYLAQAKSGALHPTGENSQNEKKEAEKLITLAQKRITQN